MKKPASLCAGILIGGESSRMGRAKHLLNVEGRTLLDRIAGVLAPFVDDVFVLGEGDLPEGCSEFRRVPDVPDVRGPLAGLLAAMRFDPRRAWIFCPCDVPQLSAEAIKWLIGCRTPGVRAILPCSPDGRVEPLLALYEPSARELLERLLVEGRRAPRRLAQHDEVATPTVPDHLVAAWSNANTPEEFDALSG